ncbi:MAG: hypothetical protein BEU00_02530 [Marine Group III euryarchaeote CG-Epi3]|mgnify:FL=1|jgi:hypothetical protein|uniref:Uncharacterized protein n=1 Tax=Marine Group III euryarchaeote CG-Epi3 TaxID=1888997 RepID=A0A1J5U520_9ARCH|nr:MAG: hypothetical protein BEU00_02530 [Marine Group III euryarchaeote CG-Epi3]|tara:strand:- start:1783 stop:2226 length:444 start_codon:yes stop_codon:yes gene_type:complete
MSTTAFRLISIEAKSHRKAARQKELQINHSTTILSSRMKNETQLNVEIRYSVSYGLLGMVQLDCEVLYSNEDRNLIETAQKKWESEHKLPEKLTAELYNRVLGEGSFEVLNIARKLGLPPPFKVEVPQVKMGNNKSIKPNTNSPEIA